MKKLIPLFGIAILTITSCATSVNSMEEFYTKYDKEATVIPLPKFAINIAKKSTNNAKFLEYINSAKLFIINNASKTKQEKVIKDLKSSTKGDKLEEYTSLKLKNNNLTASYLDQNGQISKLILGVNGLSNVMVIDSKLNITKQQLEDALNSIDLSGIEDIVDILK